MAFPENIVSTVFRGMLNAGGWMHLANWARRGNRTMYIKVQYRAGMPLWTLTLEGVGEYESESLEGACMMAVAALGINPNVPNE